MGTGHIAGIHATAIFSNPGSRLVAVSDFYPEAAAKLAAQCGSIARRTEEIIADPAIDAVLMATSTDTHSGLIEAATAAGKAAFYKKPVDLSPSRARACQKVEDPRGQPVMIGFNRRIDPNFVALKSVLPERCE